MNIFYNINQAYFVCTIIRIHCGTLKSLPSMDFPTILVNPSTATKSSTSREARASSNQCLSDDPRASYQPTLTVECRC